MKKPKKQRRNWKEVEMKSQMKIIKIYFHIYSELKYHGAVLENLTKLFTKINEIDSLENIGDFVNKYRIDLDLKEL